MRHGGRRPNLDQVNSHGDEKGDDFVCLLECIPLLYFNVSVCVVTLSLCARRPVLDCCRCGVCELLSALLEVSE